MVGPQVASFAVGGSRLAMAAVVLVILAGWGALMFRLADSLGGAIGGGAMGAVLVLSSVFFGTTHFQQALHLASGEALEDVPLATALAQAKEDVWVKLSDARVRSEASHELEFVSGGGQNDDGTPRAETRTRVAVAPVTLASAVPQEEPRARAPLTGAVLVWACTESDGTLRTWDVERQAVRGRLAPMEEHVQRAFNAASRPAAPGPAPGAFAMPAAPGASPTKATRPEPKAVLSVPPGAWCIHLQPELDAAAAKTSAFASLAAFTAMMPPLFAFLGLLFAFRREEDD